MNWFSLNQHNRIYLETAGSLASNSKLNPGKFLNTEFSQAKELNLHLTNRNY
jgi:hypothetical protein